jgi:hypothetical protein
MAAQHAEQDWDLYREIHKAMRLALFTVTTRAGSADADDPTAIDALLAEWADVTMMLEGHQHHEDGHCDALVIEHAPELRDELEAAHRTSDRALAELHRTATELRAATADQPNALLQRFHLELADFTSMYLGHLRFEESRVMPALNRAMTNAELEVITGAIRGSVPPPEMCVYMRYMVPAMNFAERCDMLGGMHAGAPPEIFEMFRTAAQDCLDAADYEAVATAVGFGSR